MDEASIREHAEGHGAAVVSGDLRRAGSDLDGEALAQAGDVMKQIPRTLESATVESLELDGDGGDVATVRTRYAGSEGEAVVESRWEERDGRPKIVSMRIC